MLLEQTHYDMRRAADRLVVTILAAIMLATACGGAADAPTSSRPARAPAPDPATTPRPDPPAPTADATGETVAQVIGTAQAATGMVVSIVLLDSHEEIEVQPRAVDDVMRMVADGQLVDGKSIAALHLWRARYATQEGH